MVALLDTNTFIFWTTQPHKLTSLAYDFIADSSNKIFLSAASGWEIAIKASLKKLVLPELPPVFVEKYLLLNGFDVLPVSMRHGLHVFNLPTRHKDPFDRLMVAQSQLENMPVITSDPLITQYGINVIW